MLADRRKELLQFAKAFGTTEQMVPDPKLPSSSHTSSSQWTYSGFLLSSHRICLSSLQGILCSPCYIHKIAYLFPIYLGCRVIVANKGAGYKAPSHYPSQQ